MKPHIHHTVIYSRHKSALRQNQKNKVWGTFLQWENQNLKCHEEKYYKNHHSLWAITLEYINVSYQSPSDEGVHASSSSTSTPSQSLGWRNITGFPWAPILGSEDRVLMFLAFRSAIAALMLSTYNGRTKLYKYESCVFVECLSCVLSINQRTSGSTKV